MRGVPQGETKEASPLRVPAAARQQGIDLKMPAAAAQRPLKELVGPLVVVGVGVGVLGPLGPLPGAPKSHLLPEGLPQKNPLGSGSAAVAAAAIRRDIDDGDDGGDEGPIEGQMFVAAFGVGVCRLDESLDREYRDGVLLPSGVESVVVAGGNR